MKHTISKKIILVTVTGMIISSVIILCISTILMSGLLNRTMYDDMFAMQSVVAKAQEQEESRLLHNVNILSTMPEFVDSVYAQDIPRVKELAKFFLRQLGLDSVVVTDADGIVIVRGHSDIAGDDISYRPTWNAARNGEVKTGVYYDEAAVVPYTIRCDGPIYRGDDIVGVISIALDIGSEEYVDNMHDMTGMHFTLFKGDVRYMTSIMDAGGNRTTQTQFENNRITDAVLENGENIIERIEIFGEPYMATYWPIKDVNGDIFGMWAIAKSLTSQVQETGSVLMIVIFCSLGIVLVLILAASLLGRRIARPILEAIDYAVHVSEGNLDVPLDIKSNDEVGTLSGALITMVATLNERMEKMREADELTQLMFDATPICCKLWSRDLKLIDCNEEAVRLFEVSSKQEFCNRFYDLSPEYQPSGELTRELAAQFIPQAFEKGYMRFEWVHQTAGGELIPSEVTLVRIKYKDDYVVAGYIRDLREQRKLMLDLENESSTLQTMFDSVSDLIFCKDMELKYSRCNISLLRYFGLREEDIIGKDDENGLKLPRKTAEEYRAMDRAVISKNKAFTYEEYVPASDGSLRLFETNKVPLLLNGKVIGIMGVARDITERKAMEEATQSANNAKSAFLANMSHEMRTPLNVVIGLTDLHLEEEGLPASLDKDLKKINIAGNILLSIVNDVLDISKIEAGKLELVPVLYNAASLLNDVITLNIIRIEGKPINFHVEINEGMPCEFEGDELRIKQIFNNLLSNAFKYTREGDVTLSVSCEKNGDDYAWMTISVSDTGIGIRKDDIKKLFSDYNQVDTKANRKIEGTGLGLSITKKLIEMMEGSITVESEYGKGTAFHVRVRQKVASNTPLGRETVENLRNYRYTDDKQENTIKFVRADMSYAKVLVVDDVQTNLDVAMGMMRKYKLQVDCVTSGQAAIDRVKRGEPVYDAIFMDHMMPEMDGIEATKRIRAIDTQYAKSVTIISLTANAIVGNEQMFLDSGFQAFLSKPISIMKLDAMLKKWVRDKSKETSIQVATPEPENSQKVSIPGINEKKGLSLYGGDFELYLPILRSFAANTSAIISKLRLVSEDTLRSYATSVHGLKGSSGSIGAEDIREQAARLEMAAKSGNLPEVLAENENLLNSAETLVTDIKIWLKKLDAGNDKPHMAAPDPALLQSLRQCCESYDMNGADKAIEKLECVSYDKDGYLVASLREKIEISDFPAAIELIDSIVPCFALK